MQSPELKWARLTFPGGSGWYAATLLNAPSNPVEQLSWRDYGRFGFFFTRSLKKDEALTVRYRLVTEREEHPGEKLQEKKDEQRADAQAQYHEFVRVVKRKSLKFPAASQEASS